MVRVKFGSRTRFKTIIFNWNTLHDELFVKADELTCCWVQELKKTKKLIIFNKTHYEKKEYLKKKKKSWIQASVEDKEPRYNAKMMNIHIMEAESNKNSSHKIHKTSYKYRDDIFNKAFSCNHENNYLVADMNGGLKCVHICTSKTHVISI